MFSQFGSLGYTIMGKTADLTVVQKTIIGSLHKEGKPQKCIAKEAGCSQSAVSKHEFWYWNFVPLLPNIGFQLLKSLWSSLTYFPFHDFTLTFISTINIMRIWRVW